MFEKFNGFFDPTAVNHQIHVVGCGAIGSTLAVMLARCGLTRIHLWDFDHVEGHNIANQEFTYSDIGKLKTDALRDRLITINPQLENTLITHGKWVGDTLSGHVFLAVDDIDLRRRIVRHHLASSAVKSFWDFRMRLKDAQHYGWDWTISPERDLFLKTMAFSQAEAEEATPVNACNMTMSIMPTVQTVVSVGVSNFINYIHGTKPKRLIMVNPFDLVMD